MEVMVVLFKEFFFKFFVLFKTYLLSYWQTLKCFYCYGGDFHMKHSKFANKFSQDRNLRTSLKKLTKSPTEV